MISKRYDYSSLLDMLRYTIENYRMTKDGRVFTKNGEEVKDIRLINSTIFSTLYCLGYRTLKDMDSIDPSENMTIQDINSAMSDYKVFNWFLNTCFNEFKIYGDMGTGKITYAPYESLAAYIFGNAIRKNVLMGYLKSQQKKIDEIQQNILVKKI